MARGRLSSGRGTDLLIGALMLLVALISPFFGVVVAGFIAYRAYVDGDLLRRNLCLGAAMVGVILSVILLASPDGYTRLMFSLFG